MSCGSPEWGEQNERFGPWVSGTNGDGRRILFAKLLVEIILYWAMKVRAKQTIE
jgi:hypothetical protein